MAKIVTRLPVLAGLLATVAEVEGRSVSDVAREASASWACYENEQATSSGHQMVATFSEAQRAARRGQW